MKIQKRIVSIGEVRAIYVAASFVSVHVFAQSTSSLYSDHWYRTPVHWAILNGHADALAVLLDLGCSPNPVTPRVHKRSSVALESPLEMNERLHSQSDLGSRIEGLLRDAIAVREGGST